MFQSWAVTCYSAPPRQTGGVPDADAGCEIIILGRTPTIPPPSWFAPTPRDIRLASTPPGASSPLLLCSAPPPQRSNPGASPSPQPPPFFPRYELSCRSAIYLSCSSPAPLPLSERSGARQIRAPHADQRHRR